MIVSYSGGKDSTAMLLTMIENNCIIDEIIYYDVETWEFPEMRNHIEKVEKLIERKITRLKGRNNFDYFFSEHILKKGKNKGTKGYGFPSITRRWCTREKIRTINRHIKICNNVAIGYNYDEIRRIKNQETKARNIIYPLIEKKITSKKALEICKSYNFNWDGLYDNYVRVSCWNCPLQRDSELRTLYTHKPELWNRLQEMQDKSWNSFRMDYTRIEDYERKFKAEKRQMKMKF